MKHVSRIILAVFALLALLVAFATAEFASRPASAAAIVVDVSSDGAPPNDGVCSLREAIENANADAATNTDCAAGAGNDTITFAGGITMIALASAFPTITDADGLTIDGDDTVTISGNNSFVIFGTGSSSAKLTLQDLVLTNGGEGAIFNNGTLNLNSSQVINSNNSGGDGGGLANFDSGTATIRDSSFSGNSAIVGSGGSISNAGMLTVRNSEIDGTAAMNGGGLYSEGPLLVDEGSAISGHAANGGGVYIALGTATIKDSSVMNALATGSGGGIYNIGTLTLDHSTVSANQAEVGAGVANESTLHVTNGSHVDGNTASGSGGGISNNAGLTTISDSTVDDNNAGGLGGGVSTSTMTGGTTTGTTITNSSISGNASSQSGGGIRLGRGTLNIVNSVLERNETTNDGGAIDYSTDPGAITITDSTFSLNSAGARGGAIFSSVEGTTINVFRSTFNDNIAENGGAIRNDLGTLTLANSTVSHNTADYGGGLYNGAQGTTTLVNVTVTANLAAVKGGGIYAPGDVPGSVIALFNTIVADQNTNSDCDALPAQIFSFGNNLDSSNQCDLDQPSDRPQVDVFLAPLADNGGPTKTHALLPNSNAIDGGDDETCAAEPIDGVDQRGIERPQGARCDIGAFERLADQTPTPTASASPTASPTGSPTQQTELWGDNDCSGVVDLGDVARGLLAVADRDAVEPVDGCPDMGEGLQFIDTQPQGAGAIFWGDTHCGSGLNGADPLDVLLHLADLPRNDVTGFCPEVGDEVVFGS